MAEGITQFMIEVTLISLCQKRMNWRTRYTHNVVCEGGCRLSSFCGRLIAEEVWLLLRSATTDQPSSAAIFIALALCMKFSSVQVKPDNQYSTGSFAPCSPAAAGTRQIPCHSPARSR